MNVVVAALVTFGLILAVPPSARVLSREVSIPRTGALPLASAVSAAVLLVVLNVAPLLVVAAIGGASAVLRALRRRQQHRTAERRRSQVLTACEGLAADLAAGLAPVHALRTMVADWPELQPVAAAAEIGADVDAAFREVATLPGAGMLRVAAAAWSVSQRSGAGLSATIALAADTVRAERATARLVASELAAAVATARLLALLPVGILVLGRGVGGDPFAFLLGSVVGQLCLTAGLGLVWSGSIWLERVADQVDPQ